MFKGFGFLSIVMFKGVRNIFLSIIAGNRAYNYPAQLL